ncbi:MAG: 23S rRNA (adenine(2503)-C(2))-methyltransferase RlmN, partial [Leptolyngbyaceae cyanobacterium SL_7_1]|nr:23S rRNA (adenine(2503)-C(2))-methyltransferase RlmN [Leptolyngbyaceae cyanobacterium SL_7_1]
MATSSRSDLDRPIATPTTVPLLGKSLAELTEWVQQQGQPAYRGKQLL